MEGDSRRIRAILGRRTCLWRQGYGLLGDEPAPCWAVVIFRLQTCLGLLG